jgi:hypothetical protein
LAAAVGNTAKEAYDQGNKHERITANENSRKRLAAKPRQRGDSNSSVSPHHCQKDLNPNFRGPSHSMLGKDKQFSYYGFSIQLFIT